MQVVFATNVGSKLYGTNTPTSDTDFKGFCFEDHDQIIGLKTFEQQEYKNGKEDGPDKIEGTIYSIRRYINLCFKGNPTVIEIAFANNAYWIHSTPVGEIVCRYVRENFLTKHLFKPYSAYHMAQMRKLESQERTGKRAAMVEEYGYDCYDKENTEFLTDSGWKFFDDICSTNFLATVEVATGNLKFSKQINKIEKNYTGKIYTHNTSLSRFSITENHNVLVSPCSRQSKNYFSTKYEENKAKWSLVRYGKIYNKQFLNEDGNYKSSFHIRKGLSRNDVEYTEVSDDYLKISGLYISDGSMSFNKPEQSLETVRAAHLTQTYKGDLKRFNKIINSAKTIIIHHHIYKYKTRNNGPEHCYIVNGKTSKILYKDYGHGSYNKLLPNWSYKLSYRQSKLLWDSLICGDGTMTKNGEVLYTVSKGLADSVQAMMTLSGHVTSVRGPYKCVANFGICYMYQIYRPTVQNLVGKMSLTTPTQIKNVVDYKVVCFETETGTLITRNKGKIAFQGNCKFALHAYRLARQCCIVMSEQTLRPTLDSEDKKMCMELRNGVYKKDEALKILKEVDVKMYEAYKVSTLKESPDFNKANDFVCMVYQKYLDGLYNGTEDNKEFKPW